MLTGAPLAHPLPKVRERIERSRCGTRKAELFVGGIARGVTLAPGEHGGRRAGLEHLAVRDFWRAVRLPTAATLRAPGPS